MLYYQLYKRQKNNKIQVKSQTSINTSKFKFLGYMLKFFEGDSVKEKFEGIANDEEYI